MAGPVKEFEVHPYVQFMMDKYSPYKKWIESEGVPIIGGEFVRDVRTEKLEYWKRKDCKGAICMFSDQMVADAYICERKYEDAAQVLRDFLKRYGDRPEAPTARRWLEGLAKKGVGSTPAHWATDSGQYKVNDILSQIRVASGDQHLAPGDGICSIFIAAAGFRRAGAQPLTGGIVALHSGWRL